MNGRNAVFAWSAMPPGQRKRKETETPCYEVISLARSPHMSLAGDSIRRKAAAFLRASFHEGKGLLVGWVIANCGLR